MSADITVADLQAMLAKLQADEDSGDESTDPIVQGTQFASLGFVAVGKGDAPSEGAIAHVPTKAGKTARVRLIDRIDLAPFSTVECDWAFTYKRLKRGES